MKKKNYVRKPWAFEEETLDTVRALAQALIDCTLSIREIEEKLTHSPGCIVMKGPNGNTPTGNTTRTGSIFFDL